MTIVSAADFSRIRTSELVKACDDDERAMKSDLKCLSNIRVSKWKNTLASQREARLDWKKLKAEQEEKERQALDLEELNIRQKFREKAIQRANSLLYEQNDRVKTLRSKQLCIDVTEMRCQQLEERKDWHSRQEKEDSEWKEDVLSQIRVAERIENEKNLARCRRAKEFAEDLSVQRMSARANREKTESEENEQELAKLKQMEESNLAELHQSLQTKLEQKKNAKAEMLKVERETKKLYSERMALEIEETKNREAETDRLTHFAEGRHALEKRHFEQRQATRNLLTNKAVQELEIRTAKETATFFSHKQELEDRIAANEAAKVRKSEELQRMTVLSWQEQIKRRKEEAAAEAKESAKFIDRCNRQALEVAAEDKRKEVALRAKRMELSLSQKEQIEENRRNAERIKIEHLLQAEREKEKIAIEDDTFKEFVLREIEAFKAHGIKTAHLEKGLSK